MDYRIAIVNSSSFGTRFPDQMDRLRKIGEVADRAADEAQDLGTDDRAGDQEAEGGAEPEPAEDQHEDQREGEQIRMAVNGQTGRVAAVIFDEKKETRFVSPLGSNVHLSAESTVHANPIEVRYKKSPHLYEIARIGRLN